MNLNLGNPLTKYLIINAMKNPDATASNHYLLKKLTGLEAGKPLRIRADQQQQAYDYQH